MGFNMAICKGKIAASIMVGAGHISPGVILEPIHEKTVIESVSLLIEENENAGRGDDFCKLKKLQLQRVEPVR